MKKNEILKDIFQRLNSYFESINFCEGVFEHFKFVKFEVKARITNEHEWLHGFSDNIVCTKV